MRITEFQFPRDHLVIDDFLSPTDLARVWRETLALGPKMKIGLQSLGAAYRDIKNNKNVLVYPSSRVGGRTNLTCKIVRESFRSSELLERFEKARSPIYRFLKHCTLPHAHVSSYHDGQYYGRHVDANEPSNLTILLCLGKEPRRFSGGDFILEFGGNEKRIKFRNNRLIIFPSNTRHEVTPVRLKDGAFDDGRFSIQFWPAIKTGVAFSNYRAKSIKSYYVPRFAVREQHWSNLQKLTFSPFSGKLELVPRVFSQLKSNLKYIGRGALTGHPQSIELTRAQLASAGELFRVSSSIRHQEADLSFGYLATRRKSRLSLQLFLKTKNGTQPTWEDACEISPQADFRKTLRSLIGLFQKMPSHNRSSLVQRLSDFARAT